MSTIIPTGFDNVTILRGSKYKGVWEWDNCDFAGLTGTVKIKNIHSQFSDVKNTYEVGTVIVEPLDADGNHQKGRILIELSKEDTVLFAIPDDEEFAYDEQSGYYSVMNVTLSDGTVILSANVKVINSLESETLNYLLDEKDEAIIINQKLDEILARKNEYISIRDNLIDVVIPNSLETYNLNHNEKMSIYNTNHNDKLSTYNSNDTIKTNDYNQNHTTKFQEVNQVALIVQADKELIEQAKLNVLAMKDNIEGNTNSVILMKNAIEAMLDNFDDRFLGQKDSDPLLDNDGNPLVIGTIYYNKPAKELRFFNGASWDSPVASAQTYALQASQYASNALASKNASKISEDNAKLSEQNAQALANQVANNYEPKNANIQSHISNSSNPHGTTASQVGAYSISESDTKFSSKINITDIVDNLTSTLTNKPLSANQGRVLKGYIDSINTLLSSDDTNLDTLQEIVAYIKANKTNLDALADIHSKTAKTIPVDADEFMTADSTTTFSLKKITWSSIKTTIKTYLDGFFIPKVATPTTNALAKIQADGTIKNSSVIEGTTGNILIGTSTDNGLDKLQVNGSINTANGSTLGGIKHSIITHVDNGTAYALNAIHFKLNYKPTVHNKMISLLVKGWNYGTAESFNATVSTYVFIGSSSLINSCTTDSRCTFYKSSDGYLVLKIQLNASYIYNPSFVIDSIITGDGAVSSSDLITIAYSSTNL